MVIKNDKVYDWLKYFGRYILPAVATFWVSLCKIWGLPYGTEISATIMAVDTLLNIILGISNENYNQIKQEEDDRLIELVSEYEDSDNG